MTSRGRHRLAASVLSVVAAAFLGTACGGGAGEQTSAHARPAERPHAVAPRPDPTATAVAPSSTSSAAPRTPATGSSHRIAPASPLSAFDGVAAPRVVDRGRDLVGIVRSLGAYGTWLEWHDPDAARVERAYAPGSDLAAEMKAKVNEMRHAHKRIVEVDRAPPDYVVVSKLANVVSFHVTEHLARRDVVDLTGRVLSHYGPATEHFALIMMRPGPADPWRLVVVEERNDRYEVQL